MFASNYFTVIFKWCGISSRSDFSCVTLHINLFSLSCEFKKWNNSGAGENDAASLVDSQLLKIFYKIFGLGHAALTSVSLHSYTIYSQQVYNVVCKTLLNNPCFCPSVTLNIFINKCLNSLCYGQLPFQQLKYWLLGTGQTFCLVLFMFLFQSDFWHILLFETLSSPIIITALSPVTKGKFDQHGNSN